MADPPVFIDTGYLVALINRRDRLHLQAEAIARKLEEDSRVVLTTDGVLIEFANFFAGSPLRMLAASSIRQVRSAPGWIVVRLSDKLMDRAEVRYAAHSDKAWSLTDCLSMEAMLDHGSTEAATADRHFLQAGFKVLMHASP